MIELKNNRLCVSFPEIHKDASCSVEFQRTLRVPDDNQDYPLPAGLGQFPLYPVDDYPVSAAWVKHGGIFLPMYQSEAMWINFDSSSGYPFAVKIAAGKINAITGCAWSNDLSPELQDYVVLPDQEWLDGFSVTENVVRQFVAMPLGEGVTAEEQVSGKAEWGGLQLIFYPMKAKEYRRLSKRSDNCLKESELYSKNEMGLAPGGRINQEIAEDSYEFDVWDTSVSSRCFVHLLNSEVHHKVTGQAPPTEPITPEQYADAGIPWFDYYIGGNSLPGSAILANMDGLASALIKKGSGLDNNEPICISQTIKLGGGSPTIRDGNF